LDRHDLLPPTKARKDTALLFTLFFELLKNITMELLEMIADLATNGMKGALNLTTTNFASPNLVLDHLLSDLPARRRRT